MRILEPSVKLLVPEDNISHVAKCARVCYGKESGDDKHLVDVLIKNKHLSMFRHATYYYIVPADKDMFVADLCMKLLDAQFVVINDSEVIKQFIPGYEIKLYRTDEFYIAINGNYLLDHSDVLNILEPYRVTSEKFANTEIGFSLMRYTFECITQISTSRELNRVSPNNIAEQSTRYVYEDGSIVRPHWINIDNCFEYEHYITYDDTNPQHVYLNNCKKDFAKYQWLVEHGVKKQDARGLLPLDTATKVIYTYSIREWRHILDLRCDTRAHPNARIIATMIKHELKEQGYDF